MTDMKAKAREEAEAMLAPFIWEKVGMPPPNVYIYKAEATDLLAAEIERRLLAEAVIEAAEDLDPIDLGGSCLICGNWIHVESSTGRPHDKHCKVPKLNTALAAYRAHGGTA